MNWNADNDYTFMKPPTACDTTLSSKQWDCATSKNPCSASLAMATTTQIVYRWRGRRVWDKQH